MANLCKNQLPFADEKHRDSSNKEPRQWEIATDYEVVVMLGDNLNQLLRRGRQATQHPVPIPSPASTRSTSRPLEARARATANPTTPAPTTTDWISTLTCPPCIPAGPIDQIATRAPRRSNCLIASTTLSTSLSDKW